MTGIFIIKKTEGKGFSEKMAMSIIKPGSASRPKTLGFLENEKDSVLSKRIQRRLQKNKDLLDENKRLRTLVGESTGKPCAIVEL